MEQTTEKKQGTADRERAKEKKALYFIGILGGFFFVFLGIEYIFDNRMALVTDSEGVVAAQGCILGISAAGFLAYGLLMHYLKEKTVHYLLGISGIVSVGLLLGLFGNLSWSWMLLLGVLLFFLLGVLGAAAHDICARLQQGSTALGRMAGAAYAIGILLQFSNHSVSGNEWIEAVVLAGMIFLFGGMAAGAKRMLPETRGEDTGAASDSADYSGKNSVEDRREEQKASRRKVTLMIVIVCLMTCIFSMLDNAVTMAHASGQVDIGQWPRLFLGGSGLLAGLLFDWREHRHRNLIMYCVMVLSVICVTVIRFGGPFLLGLLAFYLSAGFFAVYFTVSFMEAAPKMKTPELWAGMGRTVNNLCSFAITEVTVYLLSFENDIVMTGVILVLFAAASVSINLLVALEREEEEAKINDMPEKVELFAERFALTDREKEVLKGMLTWDGSVQEIAEHLSVSRAALYRYIGTLNEKTDTKGRVSLLQFYYEWNPKKDV